MASGALANVNAFASLVSGASPPTVLAVTRHVAGWSAVKVAPDTEQPVPVTANDTAPATDPPAVVNVIGVPTELAATMFDSVSGASTAVAGEVTRSTHAAPDAAASSANPLKRLTVRADDEPRPNTATFPSSGAQHPQIKMLVICFK